jgi:hypothetical protein
MGLPSPSRRFCSYAKAVAEWVLKGKPTRTDLEVDQIYKTHCKRCSWYDKDTKACKGCGCKVNTSAWAVLNKIRMATQHCPRRKW